MNYFIKKQCASAAGKISVIAGIINFLLLAIVAFAAQFNSQALSALLFLAFAVSLAAGIGTGIAAFAARREWLGLSLNFLMLGLIAVSFYFYFTLCCAPLPG